MSGGNGTWQYATVPSSAVTVTTSPSCVARNTPCREAKPSNHFVSRSGATSTQRPPPAAGCELTPHPTPPNEPSPPNEPNPPNDHGLCSETHRRVVLQSP